MEEKVLAKSQQYNAKKGLVIALGFVLVLVLVVFVSSFFEQLNYRTGYYDTHKESSWEHFVEGKETCSLCEEYTSAFAYAFPIALQNFWRVGDGQTVLLIGYAGLALVCVVAFLWLKSYELVVTDKRTYGKVAFGKRVDLPNDSISAISMVPTLKGVAVATSSGKISFLLIKNADEVYDTMNKLLMERQEQKMAAPVVAAAPAPSSASELKQYKELLDSGVISQEEFDAKKKQLLGL